MPNRKIAILAAFAMPLIPVGLVAANATPAAAATRTSVCTVNRAHAPYPSGPTASKVKVGTATIGTVTVAPDGAGLIRVTGVTHATGYSSFVDSQSGNSIDVYFTGRGHHLKFEAEVTDFGNLLLTTTVC
jgi:hypothetical protein